MIKKRLLPLAIAALFSVTFGVSTANAAVDVMLRGTEAPVAVGQAATVGVVVLNTGQDAAEYLVPEIYRAAVMDAGNAHPVGLLVSPDVAGRTLSILPNRFVKFSARITLPSDVAPGPVQIRLLSFPGSGAYLSAASPSHVPEIPAPAHDGPLPAQDAHRNTASGMEASEGEDKEQASDDASLFFDNFMAYAPIYFIYGPGEGDAKFQVSIKYRFFNVDGSAANARSFLSGFHFAYTQTSLWDLDRESKPFRDTRFMPEVFYLWAPGDLDVLPDGMRFKVQTGFMHESNGKGGAQSRSLNVAYIEPKLIVALNRDYEFNLAARGWVYVGTLGENPNIADFRGYSSIRAGIGHKNGLFFTAGARGNPNTGKGAVRLDASYPLRRITLGNLDLFLWAQVFHGYGESLIGFNQKDTSVRFGVGITR